MLDKENFEFIKSIEDNYKKATMLANIFFKDKKDKGGFPYLGHLQYVSNSFDDEDHKVVGMLHDIIEDTVVSKTILLELGFSENVVEAVDILTRKTDNYFEYINSICNSNNVLAIDIKLKDLEQISKTASQVQNMEEVESVKYGEGMVEKLVHVFKVIHIARIKNPTQNDYDRLEKYKECYEIIKRKRDTLC